MTTKEGNMAYNTEDDLHTLLNSLKDGEHIKVTWVYYDYTIAVEGPVRVCDRSVRCERYIRLDDGAINNSLISLEVSHDEEVTVTREDEKAMHALLDSLENGDVVTAEWRNGVGSKSITGEMRSIWSLREVHGYDYGTVRNASGDLHSALHSVTVRRTLVQRWEREGDE